MNSKPNPYFSSIIGFIWLSFIIVGYIITHFTLQQTIFQYIWSFILVVSFVFLAGGIGRIFSISKELPALTLIIIQVLIGFGVLSLLTLFLGLFWKINATIISIKLIFGIILFSKSIILWIKSALSSLKSTLKETSCFEIIIIIYLITIFLIQLLQSMAPPVKYDALIYHLTLPKVYLMQEKISDIPWLVMSGMPQTTEMLYFDVMSVAGESAPLILNWSFGLLTAIGLFSFLKEKLSLTSALVGVASLFSGYTLVSSLSWGYVDWAACLFGFGMVVYLNQFLIDKSRSMIFLSGLFAGLAFSTKYPAGVLFLCGFFVLSFFLWKNKIRFISFIPQYLFGASIFVIPWLMKNFVLTGNPVYPFFFASGAMDSTRIRVYQGAMPFGNLMDLFLLPIRATIFGIDGTEGYSVSIGPFFLAFSILVVLGWEKIKSVEKKQILYWAIFSMIGIGIWAVGNQISGYLIQTRFYYGLFPAFSILAAYGYDNLKKNMINNQRLLSVAHLIIIFMLMLNSAQIIKEFARKNTLSYLFGFADRQSYLEHNLGWYALAINELKGLPQESKILLIFEPRGFECVPNCDPDEILDQWKIAYSKNSNFQSITKNWVNSGYTHLFVNQQGIDFLKLNEDPHHPINELNELESFLSTSKLIKNYSDIYKLYQLQE